MKSFNDFLSTLTENELSKIAKKVNDKVKNIAESTGNDLGMQISSVSLWYSIELLRKYHEWSEK